MDISTAFQTLADWAAGTAPLYEHLCRGIADDPALFDIAAEVPADRWPPTSRSRRFTIS